MNMYNSSLHNNSSGSSSNNNGNVGGGLFSPNVSFSSPSSPSILMNNSNNNNPYSPNGHGHHHNHHHNATLPPLNSFHNYSAGVMQNFDGFNGGPSTPYGSPSFSLPATPTSTFGLGNVQSPLSNVLHSPSVVTSPQLNTGSTPPVMVNKPSTSAFGRVSTAPTPSEIVPNFVIDQVSKITDRDEYEPISHENLMTIRKSKIISPSNDSSSKGKNQSTSEEEDYEDDGSDSAQKTKSDKKKKHHPIACVQCRSLHKKCDKKLPSCSKCISRGVECTYNTPRKRGKVSKKDTETSRQDVNNVNINNNNNNSGSSSLSQSAIPPFVRSEKPNNHLPPPSVIDSYFAVLCGGHPAIEKKKLEYIVQNNYSFINSLLVTNDYNVRLPIPEGENETSFVLAFYLTIQALSEQRYGLLDLAEESHKHAEKEVSRLIDHFTNYYMVACYINMALYESGCGNYKKARFYLNNVNFYFEDEENKNKDLNFYEQNLKKFRVFVVGSCHSDIDNIGSMGTFVEMMPRMFKLASGGQDMQLPPECWQVFNSRNVTPDNYMLFMQIMDMVAKAFEKYRAILYGMATDCHSPTFFKFQDLQRAFINNGIKFLLLEKVVSVASNFAEETALKITLLTEHELFPYSGLGVMLGIINTCKFHLNIAKQIESGMRSTHSTIISSATNKAITVDYFSILQKDLRALQVLAKRYKRITLYHSQMMDEMDQIIRRKHNVDPFHTALQIQTLSNMTPLEQTGNGTDNPNDVLLSTILSYLKKAIENNQNAPPLPFAMSNMSPAADTRSDFGFPWEL